MNNITKIVCICHIVMVVFIHAGHFFDEGSGGANDINS